MKLIPTEITIHAVFLIGIGAIMLLNRGGGTDSSSRTKFTMYYIIVQGVISCTMNRTAFLILAGIIIIGGSIEILHLKRWVIPMIIFVAIAAGFTGFSLTVPLATVRTCYLLVAVFDFASEIGGRVCGRIRFLPRISPGKTLEGLAAGIFFVSAVTTVLSFLNKNDLGESFLLTAIVTASAFSGDLLASLCKRQNGIKDFSSALPGQGGVLDRFDSFILSGAMVLAFLIVCI
jgi:phosphatidate cytidylyltransferase